MKPPKHVLAVELTPIDTAIRAASRAVRAGKPYRFYTVFPNEDIVWLVHVSLYGDTTRPYIGLMYAHIHPSTLSQFESFSAWSPPGWFQSLRDAVNAAWSEYVASGQQERDAAHRRCLAAQRWRLAEKHGACRYVRYGKLPIGERSWNARDSRYEQGVSVYRAVVRGRKAFILVPDDAISTIFIMASDLPIYEVSGTACGYGADGEVLLRDAAIVRRLHSAEMAPLEIDACAELLPKD